VNEIHPHFDEPLADSAMLAHEWSQRHCHRGQNSCDWYHSSWQILRLLGVFTSIRSDDDFIFTELDSALRRGATRLLVSGAADYALLARIASAASRLGVTPRVTVIDQCRTPLELNRWYAGRAGLEIETEQTDILSYTNPGRFDLVCTHSFMAYFDEAERARLTRVWWDCLAEGGAVLTAQRVRPGEKRIKIAYTPEQAVAMGERAHQLAQQQVDQLGIDPDLARALALGYASRHLNHVIHHPDHLQDRFEQQGFVLEHFAPPGAHQPEPDAPGTPNESNSSRWRILARKPAG
jgi:hypothetical protein